MSAERQLPKIRRTSFAAIAIIATFVTGLIVACGSTGDDGAPTPGGDGGDGGFASSSGFGASSSGTGASSGNINDGAPPPLPDGAIPDECATVSPDREIDCTGKCGPVRDFCTGKIKQCGGCPNLQLPDGGVGAVQACDLQTNTCTSPKVTCADLGAECGTVKNTCGNYLDCPDTATKGCGEGKECNPDTNKCQDCQQVTCKDLGFECGFAWLGCGPNDSAHQTDCGQCADGAGGVKRTCNSQFHTCEPQCTPKSVKEICDAAKASSKKVECGVISNGCGGTVNCDTVAGFGCAAGESCGVRGIANRCDVAATPDECRAQGRQCGKIKSACDGKDITCGLCKTGEVCNDNGICGPPCTPKTCDDFKGLECGTFDDACGGKVTCGTCAGGVCDQSTNTCCKAKACNPDYAGKCGDDLPTGCGAGITDCNCTGTQKCTTNGADSPAPSKGNPGQCCTPKTSASYVASGVCGKNLTDGCGGKVSPSCAAGLYCVDNQTGAAGNEPADGVAGTCCTPQGSCSDQGAGKCSPVANSCRPNGQPQQSCTGQCTGATPSCVGGNCCTPAAACAGNGGENAECNITKPGNGCGSDRPCNCAGGRICTCGDHACAPNEGAGLCKTPLTCSAITGANGCGTGLPNGAGGTTNCGCGAGRVCSTSTPGQIGTCQCDNPTGAAYTCANVPNGPNQAGGDACGSFNNGCGGSITCNCASGKTCNSTPNPNICCTAPAACTGNGGDGAECNVTKTSPDGCGSRTCSCTGARQCWCGDHACTAADGPGACKPALTCNSPAYAGKCGTGLDNGVGGTINCNSCGTGRKCSTTTPGATGTCICDNGTNTGYTCANVPNGPNTGGDACGNFSDGCGGNITCNCTSGQVCYTTPNPNTCCTPLVCPATPGKGTLCGNGISNTCGGNINCGCPTGPNNTNWTCTANKCDCVPDTCRGRTGPQNDLCGGTLQCGG